ncbi:MAG: amidohydrolase family protein [Phycisphaerales bacterium]
MRTKRSTLNDRPGDRTYRSYRSYGSYALALGALGALFAGSVSAQDLGIKAPPQSKPYLILNATIHPITARPMEGWILLDLGEIQGLGMGQPPEQFRRMIPASAEVIEGKGKHVYPGLIAANTQLGLAEIAAVRASNDFREVGAVTPEVRAASSINPDSTLIPVTRSNGILTAAVFPEGGRIPGRVSVIRMDGWTWEEMSIVEDAGVAVEWPQMRPVAAAWMERSEAEQAEETRKAVAVIEDSFASARAYLDAREADPTLPVDLRWEAMRGVFPAKEGPEGGGDAQGRTPTGPADAGARDARVARQAGVAAPQGPRPPEIRQKKVFITAQDVDQITAAVAWAVRSELKPVIVGGRDAPLVADLLKRHGVPVIITGTHSFPKRADSPYDDAFTLPARLAAAGIRFAIASADRTAHERNLPYNAATAVAYGLAPEAALRSLTLDAAEIMGIENRHGALESRRPATVVLTDGDILEVTTNVERAWIDGREIDLSNKQTVLADKYREKYRQKGSMGAGKNGEGRDAKGP